MYVRKFLPATMLACGMVTAETATVLANDILGYPEDCACIVQNIDDFLIVSPDWAPVGAPEPEDGPFPPDIIF